MTNEQELAKIITYTREIESILKDKFNVQGKGLHTYLDKISFKIDEQLLKNLRYIATIRNKSMHESEFQVDNFIRYENVAQKSISKLKELKKSPINSNNINFKRNRGKRVSSRNNKHRTKRNSSDSIIVNLIKNIIYVIIFIFLFIIYNFIVPFIKNISIDTRLNDPIKVDVNEKYIVKENELFIEKEVKNVIYITSKPKSNFRCRGKIYCSQMSSCEEATFYINNCPNTKMDGDGDGIPCRRQWCH